MAIDAKKIADRLVSKEPGGGALEAAEGDMPPAEGGGATEHGKMMLAAIEAGDPTALAEAVKACAADSSY